MTNARIGKRIPNFDKISKMCYSSGNVSGNVLIMPRTFNIVQNLLLTRHNHG